MEKMSEAFLRIFTLVFSRRAEIIDIFVEIFSTSHFFTALRRRKGIIYQIPRIKEYSRSSHLTTIRLCRFYTFSAVFITLWCLLLMNCARNSCAIQVLWHANCKRNSRGADAKFFSRIYGFRPSVTTTRSTPAPPRAVQPATTIDKRKRFTQIVKF